MGSSVSCTSYSSWWLRDEKGDFSKTQTSKWLNYDFVFTGAPDCREEKMNWGSIAHLTLSVPALLVSRGSEGADSFSTKHDCPNYKSRVLCSRHSQKRKRKQQKTLQKYLCPRECCRKQVLFNFASK